MKLLSCSRHIFAESAWSLHHCKPGNFSKERFRFQISLSQADWLNVFLLCNSETELCIWRRLSQGDHSRETILPQSVVRGQTASNHLGSSFRKGIFLGLNPTPQAGIWGNEWDFGICILISCPPPHSQLPSDSCMIRCGTLH